MTRPIFAPDPGNSRLIASMDRLLAARDLRRGGNATPAAIDASPSARLAASMDRELARQGIRKAGTALGFVSAAGNPGVSEASKPVDISGMDLLSRSMRAALPQAQRAAYDQSWAQAQPGTIPAGATVRASIHETPSARLAASMDRLLAARDLRGGGNAAPAAIDVSHMDTLSRSMRARLPAHQRAAYDRDWKQSELERPAPIAPKVFAPSPPPAIAPTPRVDATASGVFDPQPPAAPIRVDAIASGVFDPQPPAASALALLSPPGTTAAKAASGYARSGDTAIFAAAFGREPRDIAELDKAYADADARSLARGPDKACAGAGAVLRGLAAGHMAVWD